MRRAGSGAWTSRESRSGERPEVAAHRTVCAGGQPLALWAARVRPGCARTAA
jgi:hypothetical protein